MLTPEEELELKLVSRWSSEYTRASWHAIAEEVWMGREYIGRFTNEAKASYVCSAHNLFLRISNELVQQRTEIQDLRKVLRHVKR